MSLQPLPGLEAPPALTRRQAFALDVVRLRGPIPASELGAWLHEFSGRHGHAERCQFDTENGHAAAEALRRKGLVRRLRGRGWVVREWREAGDGYDPATSAWPEGF